MQEASRAFVEGLNPETCPHSNHTPMRYLQRLVISDVPAIAARKVWARYSMRVTLNKRASEGL